MDVGFLSLHSIYQPQSEPNHSEIEFDLKLPGLENEFGSPGLNLLGVISVE